MGYVAHNQSLPGTQSNKGGDDCLIPIYVKNA